MTKLDYSRVAKSIAHTIEKGSKKLTDDQFMCMAGAIAVYLELAQATPVQPTEPVDVCGFCGSKRAHLPVSEPLPPEVIDALTWIDRPAYEYRGLVYISRARLDVISAYLRRTVAHPPVVPVASEEAIQEVMRLADEYGHPIVTESRAALEAAVRKLAPVVPVAEVEAMAHWLEMAGFNCQPAVPEYNLEPRCLEAAAMLRKLAGL